MTVENPYWRLNGRTPIALQTENLPPTKSQNPNTLFGLIPNLLVSLRFVEHAQTCLSTISCSSLTPSFYNSDINHLLDVLALSMVSAVVNVFEATTKRVYSGFKPVLNYKYLQLPSRNQLDPH